MVAYTGKKKNKQDIGIFFPLVTVFDCYRWKQKPDQRNENSNEMTWSPQPSKLRKVIIIIIIN